MILPSEPAPFYIIPSKPASMHAMIFLPRLIALIEELAQQAILSDKGIYAPIWGDRSQARIC